MNTPTFRLFVSSTFGDMKAEREILQARVFPRLRDYCKSKGAMFQAVDLRWGISEEAGLDQQTMNICLRELRRCQETTDKPNFLVLLGDRYGWHPLPPQIDAEEFEELEGFLTTESTDTESLKRWYKRDANADPAQYVLLPREGEFEEPAAWDAEERSLRAILLRAIALAGWSAADPRREKYEHSATHQEIDAGALALPDPKDRVLACFRTITDTTQAGNAFTDRNPDGTPDEEARLRLCDLRTELESRLPATHRYSYEAVWNEPNPSDSNSLRDFVPSCETIVFNQDAFTAWVEESLLKIIDREIAEKQAKAADPLDQENTEHAAFGRERAHRFVGRKDLLAQIGAYMRTTDSGQSPFVVHGVSGTGKTALMGNAVLRQKEDLTRRRGDAKNAEIILERYIGATPGSSNLRSLLTDLCKQLHRALDFEALKAAELADLGGAPGEEAQKQREAVERKFGIPDDLNKLIEHFRGLPARVPEDRRLVLVLDALDQLDEEGNPHTLAWLPERLPSNVRVVLSVLDRPDEPAGRAADSALLRFPDALHEITPLAPGDAGELLDGWLADAGRVLQPAQRQSVLVGFAECGLPLWLKLVSEEARTWHAWRPPEDLPVSIPALLDHFLGELEEPGRHGHELVSTTLGYLAAARNGLADEELLDVVALDDEFWTHFTATARQEHQIPERRLPPVLWARLHGDLAFALAQRHADNATLHTFYHRQIAEAARRRYLDPRSRELHSRLGDYFNAQPHFHDGKPNLRKLSELVPLLIGGERWDDLIGDVEKIGPLSDLLFIQAKCQAGRVHELVGDYNHALSALPEFAEENACLAKRDAAMIAFNQALKAYAVKLFEWPEFNNIGDEPKYPLLPAVLRDDAKIAIPEERSPRAARLRHFANFVSGHLSILAQTPNCALPLANNWAEGPVADSAERQIRARKIPFLRRSPRPPAPPLRPQCLRTLEGHQAGVSSVNVSPDGHRALSASDDKTLRVWDLNTGKCLRVLIGHTDGICSVRVSADWRGAVSGGLDKTLRVWDLETGYCLQSLEGHVDGVYSVSVSPDGRRAVWGGYDKTLRVLDLKTGCCMHTLEGHAAGVLCVSVSPDGRRAISGSSDTTLRVWDLVTGRCQNTLKGHLSRVKCVTVSPDGRRAVSGSDDKTLRVWDLEAGHCIRTLEGHEAGVLSVCVSPDGRHGVSGALDKTLRLWNLETGQCIRCFEGHEEGVRSVSVSPNGRRAVSSSSDKTLRVWDLETGQIQRTLEGHAAWIRTMSVYPNGRHAVSGSDDKTLRVWNLETGQCLRSLKGHTDLIWIACVSPDGCRAISGSEDKTLRVWDLETGECLRILLGHTARVRSVSVSPDGRLAVSGGLDKTLRIWDIETGLCLQTLEGHTEGVWCVSLTPDGRRVISGSLDKTLRVWDPGTGQCLLLLEGHTEGIWSVRISPDGRRAISGSLDMTLRVWDMESGQCLRCLKGHTSRIRNMSLSPEGQRAVSGSDDKTIRVWDLGTGQCIHTLEGHADLVWSVCISCDGQYAVSGSENKTLRLWNLGTGQCISVYHAASPISSVAYSLNGRHICCGTDDGQMHFLTPDNLSPSGPVIITALDAKTARCPHCAASFTPSPEVVASIQSQSGILSPCPHCAKPLQFNPFFVEHLS